MSEPVDALVVGSGPVGLYLAFQLGLLGLRPVILEAADTPGGQCAALYGDKPIYDIPACPAVTGQELIARLQQQLAPLKVPLHLSQMVQTLARCPDGDAWQVGSSTGRHWLARSVFVAAGVGAFQPRLPTLAGIDTLLGRCVHTHDAVPPRSPTPPTATDSRPADPIGAADLAPTPARLLVLGGDEAAVRTALTLCRTHPEAQLWLMHRRDVWQAESADLQALAALRAQGRLTVLIGQPQALHTTTDPEGTPRLRALDWLDAQGDTHTLALDHLLVRLGLSPKLGPVASWGLAMDHKLLRVDPATQATDAPGIYAVGDVVTYPGKKKLIACGFHEAIQAAWAAAVALGRPEAQGPLLYTSSSALLQGRLGVARHPGANPGGVASTPGPLNGA